VSRHHWTDTQEKEPKRIFGEIELHQFSSPFKSAEEIYDYYKRGRYDDMVVVAPLSVIARIRELGIKPLWAEMEVVPKEEAEVEASGRYFRFKRFRRIKAFF